MIRKLKEEDRQITLDFLSEEAAINLFIIGDIENFGFDEDFQELWGSFNDVFGKLEGVLLRYHESYIPYYKKSQFDISGFMSILESDKTNKILSGKENIVDNFRGILREPIEKGMYFCELREKSKLKEFGDEIKLATVEDAVRVFDLLEGIEEFQTTDTNSIERIKRVISTKTGRIYYIEDAAGTMMTIAQTTAENSKSAMVVGVATRKEYRKKGLMSQCLSKLCDQLLSEGKTLCLFYNNPEAGSVYHKMGFQSIGRWKMLIESKKSKIDFYDVNDEERTLTYVVICAKFKEQWIFVRHKDRTTWEVPGGHIEENELPDDAAGRELIEETGAIKFQIKAICDYSVQTHSDMGYGRLYYAKVEEIGQLPEFEIAEIALNESLPDELTYPEIQPVLHAKVINHIEVYKLMI